MAEYTIELDCPPGSPRPGDLLPQVLAGTGVELKPEDTVSRFFGNWTWVIPEEQVKAFEESRELIKERITDLYHRGMIRYGSW